MLRRPKFLLQLAADAVNPKASYFETIVFDLKQAICFFTHYYHAFFISSKSLGDFSFLTQLHNFILIDPFFESLRDHPEFKSIVKQVQDEKAELRAQVRQMEVRGELNL